MSADKNPDDLSFAERAYAGSRLGMVAFLAGLILAAVFLVRFEHILDNMQDKDLRGAIQALEITVVSVWIAVALWGWYLIKDGMERANTNRRLNAQSSSLSRIERALADMDREKEELTEKSRSFWNFRRGEPG